MTLNIWVMILLSLFGQLTQGRPRTWNWYADQKEDDTVADWNWYADQKEDDTVADYLSQSSVFYNTFIEMQRRMGFYAPSTHVGHIDRGHYQKPERLQPRYRTFGWDSDFRQQDKNAFRNAPTMPKTMCREIKKPSTSAGFDCRCGVPNRREKDPHHAPRGSVPSTAAGEPQMEEIIGGTFAEKSEYPWQVYLSYDSSLICGGSIISGKSILTAAHCLTAAHSLDCVVDSVKVMVAGHKYDYDGTKQDAQELSVCDYHIHPQYQPEDFPHDFAILDLCSEIKFHTGAQPVCLPSQPGPSYEGVPAIISGWGVSKVDVFSSSPFESPDKLKEANVTTIPTSVCNNFWQDEIRRLGGPGFLIEESMICARAVNDDGYTCYGDSGGPLLAQERCGHYALVGGASFSWFDCNSQFYPWGQPVVKNSVVKNWVVKSTTPIKEPLKGSIPFVFARVTHALDWIVTNMKGSKCPPPSSLVSM